MPQNKKKFKMKKKWILMLLALAVNEVSCDKFD